MTNAKIETLWSTPLKGARGHRRRYLFIDTKLGVKDDRQYAIRRRAGDMTAWAPKGVFHVCMNTEQMAVENPTFVEKKDPTLGNLDPEYLRGLAHRLGVQGDLPVQYAGDKYSLHDTKGAYVSFLNLASLRALSEFMGTEIDPRRFRMNVWLSGLEPFEELTWVDGYPGTREMVLGECRFRIDDACERCKAPEANPSTGKFDLEIQDALDRMMSMRGYKSPHRGTPRVMGILAAPMLEDGLIQLGDRVQLV